MATTTVFGAVADGLGQIVQTETTPSPWGGTWQQRSYLTAPSTMYRRSQCRAPVRVDHEGAELGTLEHLELWPDKQLVAVALVDLPDDITIADGSWRWSPTIRSGHRTGVIDMFELSLTQEPASLCLRAVRALPGNLRSRDRDRWDVPTSIRRMLERAAAAPRDRPITVHTDTGAPPPAVATRSSALDLDLYRRPPSRPTIIGPMRYSKPVKNSIIAVY